MTARKEKCTEEIKVHLGEKLKLDLQVLANTHGDGHLSSYIRTVLRKHVYGQLNPNQDLLAGSFRDD